MGAIVMKSAPFMLTFVEVMPYNRNNKNDKPFKKDYSEPGTGRKKRSDSEDDRPNTRYNPDDKDELAPPRFLAPPPNSFIRKSSSDAPKRPYEKRDSGSFGDRPKRPYEKRDTSSFGDKPKRPYEKRDSDSFGDKPKRPYEKRDSSSFGDKPKRPYEKRESSSFGDNAKRPYEKRKSDSFGDNAKKPYEKRDNNGFNDRPKRPYEKRDSNGFDSKKDGDSKKPFRPNYDPEIKNKKQFDQPKKTFGERKKELTGDTGGKDDIRLNKYVANSGICSRREADELIAKGMVTVNGKVVKEMGHRVKLTDTVTFDGKKILPEPYVYIIMNKPKDFLTTTEDDRGRKTVMDLVADKIEQRIFPVGRLDRNTTGVLLLTNDGEVTQALTHPSFEIKKIYQVELDKKATSADLDKLVSGIELEDGEIHADGIAFVESEDKRHVGIEIHSGRTRIVRRMFEHLGYEVEKLDRVSFGIFTKKDLPRGKWRHLTQSEVGFLMKLKSKM